VSVIQTLLAFIFALGVLVAIHEFGHYWVARRCGVKILRFSIGFGRPVYLRRFGPDQTEFVVAAIPLGGYVKMLDEREGQVAAQERARAFNQQTLGKRVAIVVAGPAFNFLLAILAFWLMYIVGVTGPRPIIGSVVEDSIAGRAGLAAGQEIVAIDGRPTPTWETVLTASVRKVLDATPGVLTVVGANSVRKDVLIDFGRIDIDDVTNGSAFERLGLEPKRSVEPIIDDVQPGGAADRAGLRSGDEIVEADGRKIADWAEWVSYIRAHAGRRVDVRVVNAGVERSISLTPVPVVENGELIGFIGASAERPPAGIERYGPVTALPQAMRKTWSMTVMTLKIMRKMIVGQASVQNLSGPISIAQYAGQSVSLGFSAFVSFLAVVSVGLGVLNLLPIPLLDGGHLLFYLIEFVTRRPVSEAIMGLGQQIGFILLLGLMGIAVYNDIMRIF
jgi:regulator of sigma E protease